MDHAKYIGRIGALAVALGIGAAVSTQPALAWADETTAAPHSTSRAAAASGSATEPDRAGRTGQSGSSSLSDEPTDSKHVGETSSEDRETDDDDAAPDVVVSTSGGAGTSHDDERVDTDERPPENATADSEPTDHTRDARVAGDTAGAPAPQIRVERRHRWSSSGDTLARTDRQPDDGEATETPAARTSMGDASSSVSAPVEEQRQARFTRIVAPTTRYQSPENPPTLPVVGAEPIANPMRTTTSARNPIGTLIAIPATLFVSTVNVVVNFFEPVVGPGGPLENSLLWGLLAWTRRQLNHTLANRGPEIGQDSISVTVDEGSANNSIGVLPATDADGDPTVYTVAPNHGPGNGNVAIDGNTVTYTPDPGFAGTDSFTLVATDAAKGLRLYRFGYSRTDTATVVITVEADEANDPPVANPDSSTVSEGGTVTVDVIGNDTDSDGSINPATVVVVGEPAHGTATANADGTVTYVSNGAEVTSDRFTYTVNDNSGATSDTATVTIAITAADDHPVAVDDTIVTSEGARSPSR